MSKRLHESKVMVNVKRRIPIIAIVAAFAMLIASGCNANDGANAGSDQSQGGAGSSSARDLPQGAEPVDLDPKDFTTRIDNPYWPMDPGTRWTYRETDEEGAELKVVVTVSNQTKKIANDVTARVVRDTVTEDGELIEDTFDWYAQDREGNIWYLGENTAEFENGKLVTKEGSFEAGVDGAQPGIIMPADPRDGMQYRQEYYKGEAEDNGEVLSTDEMAQVPFGQYDNALLTKDTITIEPNVLEYKLYARDVGPVLTLGVSGGPGSREELINLDTASQKETEEAGSTPLGSAS
ncbi:MAG TPA: hypothetical protein VHM69_04455 [Rubrobacter sp.]|nr:hypothetical protein [Rubrobacter sp.]